MSVSPKLLEVSTAEFKDAMARLSAHVTVVTGYDGHGRPHGLTASAVCSLSLNPPLMIVCLSRTAVCHDILLSAPYFAVNVLRSSQQDLAERFATSGIDRFEGADFFADLRAPHLSGALSVLTCSVFATYPGGDHTILVGHVDSVETSSGEPLVYFDRRFCELSLAPAL